MQKALFVVVALGAALGLMTPGKRDDGAPPSDDARDEAEVAPAVDDEQPRETRVERMPDGHFYVHASVNDELVHFLVDTGASTVALTVDDAERIGVDFSESSFEVIGTGASGDVRGQLVMFDRVSLEGKGVGEVRGAVIEGLEISLLGQSYLGRIRSVSMSGDYMVLR